MMGNAIIASFVAGAVLLVALGDVHGADDAEKAAKADEAGQTKESTDEAAAEKPQESNLPALLQRKMNRLDGEEQDFAAYEGDVILIVNVASKCGFTPQYEALQQLHEDYHEQGLTILGFPCNQFRNQEPGTNEQIAAFCKENYGVEFDMFEKLDVKGKNQSDLYKFLTSTEANPKSLGEIKWNFEKFLFDHKGNLLGHYRRQVKPDGEEMMTAIKAAIAARHAEKPTAEEVKAKIDRDFKKANEAFDAIQKKADELRKKQ